MKTTATIAAAALAACLFGCGDEKSADAKVKDLKEQIAEIEADLKDAGDDEKADLTKKLEKLKEELAEATKQAAEEAGDKLKEGVGDLLGDDK